MNKLLIFFAGSFYITSSLLQANSELRLQTSADYLFGASRDETVVKIGGLSKTIDKGTSCAPDKWNRNNENSCQCCLAKHQLEGHGPEKSFNYCTVEKKYCTSSNLAAIATKLDIRVGPDLPKIVSAIYEKVNQLPIIPVTPAPPALLSPKDVTNLLSQANLRIDNQEANPACYQAKQLSEAGGATLQLFLVSYASACPNLSQYQPIFIFKEMKKATEEVRNLAEVEQAFKDQDPESLKKLALPIKNFVYYDSGKKAHFISVLPVAQGQSLKKWLDEYYNSPTEESKNTVNNIFLNFGKEMAAIHINFMQPPGAIFGKTVNHGDAHFGNIFSTRDGKITFIDNETIARSLNEPQPPTKDLILFFMLSTVTGDSQNVVKKADLSKREGIESWLNLTLKPFLSGYTEAYLRTLGINRKPEVIKALKATLLEQSTISMLKMGKVMNPLTYSKFKPYVEKIINEL